MENDNLLPQVGEKEESHTYYTFYLFMMSHEVLPLISLYRIIPYMMVIVEKYQCEF